MSEPLRFAVTVEGPTDAIVLEAILTALLPDDEFVFQRLQPEGSAAFGSAHFGSTGTGWAGVYRWSRQAVSEGGGSVSESSALANHDVLSRACRRGCGGGDVCQGKHSGRTAR